MVESVLLGTKPLVYSIRHFIRDPSGVFSVCHLCECRIVQWRHDSRLLLLLNWLLHKIKITLHVGSKIWILCSCHSNIKFLSSRHCVISAMYLVDTVFKTYFEHYHRLPFWRFINQFENEFLKYWLKYWSVNDYELDSSLLTKHDFCSFKVFLFFHHSFFVWGRFSKEFNYHE